MQSTIDAAEVAQFARQAALWWDETGPFKPLHAINYVRLDYIAHQISQYFGREMTAGGNWMQGLEVLDIGCGGGLMCEPLARLGAQVRGIDAAPENIGTASHHAEQSGVAIDYAVSTAEAQAQAGKQYDIVLALEIVEHVADVEVFLAACAACVKPGGLLVVSTINRTLKSLALAKIGAEYILRWVPRGTHDWRKFLRPSEVEAPLRRAGLSMCNLTGMIYHPIRGQWGIAPQDTDINYLMVLEKPA
ncbi:MAG: bifunctional 2-polyprenyl-6-hydroxyphenol methylase/3-demethylubiquinol 3-O-methyltransferase UbiG [Anaerolineae bacterium]|nr:bifunctional 2-polyprenyl-6-hydroxyphenol methylase/3-demethylubiquinol 3-O-methyltransferase UbiG [Anaerolineae bacterium]